VIADTLQPKEVNCHQDRTTELHELIGSMRRCVTALASKYGTLPPPAHRQRRERILNDIDRLDIDAEELELGAA